MHHETYVVHLSLPGQQGRGRKLRGEILVEDEPLEEFEHRGSEGKGEERRGEDVRGGARRARRGSAPTPGF